jgi:uncharacterized protein (UPF0179 family)
VKVGLMAWRTCPKCKANVMTHPLPEGWSYTVRRFKDGISHVTVHDEACPKRFKVVEIPDVE